MKRFGNLFEQICTIENLELADKRARKNKANTPGVRIFDRHRDELLPKLLEQLKNGTYHTSPYTTFIIREPKERVIYRLPYFPDRIVHHAIMNILEPIWVSTMTADTYSCLKGRGIHAAVNKVKTALRDREGTRYCLKMDVRKFYPSINHEVLKQLIRRKIKDERLLALLDEIIDSADGVPIGNYLSQYFANIYLSALDHKIKEQLRVRYYFRYADDMVILSSNKEELHRIRLIIQDELAKLKIELKGNYQVFPVESRGVDFLGYVFRHDYTRLRKSTKQRLFRKLQKLTKTMHGEELRCRMSSYNGWLKYCNSQQLTNKINKIANYEIIK